MEFEVTADGIVKYDGVVVSQIVMNNYRAATLPATGSNTSLWVMLFGAMIMCSGVIVITRKKREDLE